MPLVCGRRPGNVTDVFPPSLAKATTLAHFLGTGPAALLLHSRTAALITPDLVDANACPGTEWTPAVNGVTRNPDAPHPQETAQMQAVLRWS